MATATTRRVISLLNETREQRMMAAGMPTFLQDFVFGEKTFNTERPVFDTARSTLLAAQDRATLADGHDVAQGGYTSDDSISPLLFSERSNLNREKIAYAKAQGQDPNQVMSADRMSRLLDTYSELEMRIYRGIERACSELLFNASVQVRGTGGTIDFVRKATHSSAAAVDWDDAAAVPLTNLETACELIAQDGYVVPARVIMGRDAAQAFFANAEVARQLDQRHNSTISRDHDAMPNGGVYAGKVVAGRFSLGIWTAPTYYQESEAGAKLPYVPNDKILVLPDEMVSKGNFILAFGAVPYLSRNAADDVFSGGGVELIETKTLPRLYGDDSGETLTAVCESRPVPYAHTLDKLVSMAVV